MFDIFVAWGVLLATPLAFAGAVCALNAMHISHTPHRIIAAFLAIAIGWLLLFFAALDYLSHNQPKLWPWALLGGVFLLALGNAVLYLVNRRDCKCPGCPARRSALKS